MKAFPLLCGILAIGLQVCLANQETNNNSLDSSVGRSADIKNTKLEELELDESSCDQEKFDLCAEYLISKYNQDNNYYASLEYLDYQQSKTGTSFIGSPDEILKEAVSEIKGARENQDNSIDTLGGLVQTSSKEAFIFTEQNLYIEQIRKNKGRSCDVEFVLLSSTSIKTKAKIAILGYFYNQEMEKDLR